MTSRATTAAKFPPLTNVAAALLFAWALLVWFEAVPIGHLHTGDTDNLVLGARLAAECIREGVFSECGLIEGTVNTRVFPYALLQYLPASAFIGAGLSDEGVVEALARLNLIAFVASLLLAWVALRSRGRGIQSIAVLAILASTATYQATSGFGEMLTAALVLACVTASVHRRPLLIVVTAALASTGRETLAPFVFLLGALAGRREDARVFPPARVLGPLAVGVMTGVVASAAFNFFRFGVVQNVLYLSPLFRTPGIARKFSHLAGLWVAPAGGLLWYWPVATLALVGGAMVAIVHLRRDLQRPRTYLPASLTLAAALTFTAGLASWWSPFGWISYGPRLVVPLMPALAVLILYQTGSTISRWLSPMASTKMGAVAIVGVLAAAGWPQYGAPWSYGAAIDSLIAPASACTATATIEVDPNGYYRCLEQLMWRFSPSPIASAATAGDTVANTARVVALLAACALAFEFTRGCRYASTNGRASRPLDQVNDE